MAARPWTVFVRSIGPTFTFSTEERAAARARELVERDYFEVVVWGPVELPLTRRIFRAGSEHVERLDGGEWTKVAADGEG